MLTVRTARRVVLYSLIRLAGDLDEQRVGTERGFEVRAGVPSVRSRREVLGKGLAKR